MGSWKDEVTMVHITQEQVEDDLQCYICLDDLTAGEEVMRLSCSHHYHEPCISPWLDKNNICPTCRQKILHREDPDPEEYDFEFDAGFLTDIIREINNIVYGVDSDEEFFHSDSPDIVDLTISSDGETLLLEDLSPRSERNTTSQDTLSEDSVDNVVPHLQEPESQDEVIILSDASSGEETQSHQSSVKNLKRVRSFEVEDSSDDEDGSLGNHRVDRYVLQDVNRNQQNTLSSQNAQPMKELIPFSVNRNNQLGSRRKLRKRQRRSLEVDESEYDQDSSDEDFEFHTTYTTEGSNRKNEEKKQLVRGKENSEETKRGNINKTANESTEDETEEGVYVFDMVEVESLVSKLLEIMNQGEDVSNTNDDEGVVQTEDWRKRGVLNQECAQKNENSDDDCDELYNNENSKTGLNNMDKAFSKSVELLSEDETNGNILRDRPRTERTSSPGHRKAGRSQSVKRKTCSSCSSDDESSDDNTEFPVKRKASSSDSESCDDSDGFENIEQIISELWSIVNQDEEESESDHNASGGVKNGNKTKQKCSPGKESSKRHEINHQPLFQSKKN